MNLEQEIAKVENILRGRFDNPNDKRYWEDKLQELRSRLATAKANEAYFKSYEKGVSKSAGKWVSGYLH